MSRSHVKLTEELGLIGCSCGRCCNVKEIEKLRAENEKLMGLLDTFFQYTLVNYPEEDENYDKDVEELRKIGITNGD